MKKIEEHDFFSMNAELSSEFSKYVLGHPEIDEIFGEDAFVIFLPEFSLSLKEYNLKIAKELSEEGKKVIYVKVQKMKSTPASRLIGVEIIQKDYSLS